MQLRTQSLLALLALAGAASLPARAELASPNSTGYAMGHVHLVVNDVEAEKKVFVALGGTPIKNGVLDMVQFPGTFIVFREGAPSGGSAGSTINHFGFHVKSVAETVERAKPLPGVKVEQPGPAQAFVIT